ncbi:DNA polymerase subunit gamma-2, mitochondrial-like [Apostichopus japonicus]|uniref:DNA polymerase subunit gamma-2, mitochondrial-like n=1 Tax=Stichopus japonicus TaxID=307972 RepID=UPI003AB5674D
MSSKVRLGHFKKVIALCQRYGFIHQSTAATDTFPLSYGHLGSELRRNLINSWWRDVVTQQGLITGVDSPFTKHIQHISEASTAAAADPTEGTEQGFSTSLDKGGSIALADLLPHYQNALTMSERGLPVGLATVGHHRSHGSFKPDRYIFQSHAFTYMHLSFFCAPKDASRWQNMWQRSRLQWWKKFSWTPSTFTSTDVRNEDGKQVIEIKYPFPWGEDVIERLTNHGSTPMEEIQEKKQTLVGVRDGRKLIIPHLIQSVGYLEGGMLAYLLEAYQDVNVPTTTGKKKRQFMRLHTNLCPVKVAIVIVQASDQLQEVSDLLAKDFRSADVNVIQATEDKSPSKTFEKLDIMGVPYSVLLTEDTVKSGTVKIRSRDTTLTQEINITKVMQTLQL